MTDGTDMTGLPLYAPAGMVRERIAHVSARVLRDWWRQGFVRALKTGAARQSGMLFNTDDVRSTCERFAAGYSPRRKTRHARQI